ncbi:MAG: Ig-like domain-containing protein, partial [Deltaproteobacteria bacterium]|nr:Ig-like domain-containing protein [Deltaproteobacteria bacterium]
MNSRWLACSFALLGLMLFGHACKGDGGEPVIDFLEVLQTSPPDRSTAAVVETRIGFQVNATIDPATLTNDTFFVTASDGTRVVGLLTIGDEPNIAVLTPDEPLAVITDFTAIITTGLSSPGGVTLEENFVWRFTTLDSEWGEPEWVEDPPTGSSSRQQIAIDGQSNALAVWEHSSDAAGSSIWANHYTRTGLWEEAEPIDTGNGVATAPRLAADAAGNGFAVWQEDLGSGSARIWTNLYVVDQGWGAPELLQNGEVTTARSPAIAAEPTGNAIAIWIQQDMVSSQDVIWSNRYVPGSGWGAAEPIGETLASLTGSTAVGMDATGNGIAMWTLPTFSGHVIWANRYTVGLGWGTAELIKPDADTNVRGARLTVGSTGDAFVIWGQDGAEYEDVWSARFSGSTWGAPERIDGFDGG